MKLVYLGPSLIDDPWVYTVAQTRAAVARGDDVIESVMAAVKRDSDKHGTGTAGTFNPALYRQMILNIAAAQGEISDVALVTMPETSELEMLNGTYEGVRKFHDEHLPGIREAMASAVGQEIDETLLHVDMGDSLGTLYAAYFAIQHGISTSVTFHSPRDPEKSFAIGGHSEYGRFRPNLRRMLGRIVIRGSDRVFVSEEGMAGVLASLFNLKMRYFGDPLTDQGATAPRAPLPSPAEE